MLPACVLDLVAFLANIFAAHQHTKLSLPATKKVSKATVTFDGPVNTQAAVKRLEQSFAQLPPDIAGNVLNTLTNIIVPTCQKSMRLDSPRASKWNAANLVLIEKLPSAELFPMVDLLRMASSKPELALLLKPSIVKLLDNCQHVDLQARPKNTFLLELRTFTNTVLLVFQSHHTQLKTAAIDGLLHENDSIRSAAASLAFSLLQIAATSRVDWQTASSAAQEDFETEILSALVECLGSEKDPAVG